MRMQGENTTAAGVLEALVFMAVIDANTRHALLLNEVVYTQLAQFFKLGTSAPPRSASPAARGFSHNR